MFLTLYLSQASSAIFETRTKEKIRHFDEEEEEDIWEDKEINYATRKQVKARSRFITHIMMPLHLFFNPNSNHTPKPDPHRNLLPFIRCHKIMKAFL